MSDETAPDPGTGADPAGPVGPIVACVKWVDLRPQVDPVHGNVAPSARGGGFSAADRAALEVALRLGEAWRTEVVLVCAGPASADTGLLELASSGVGRVVRIDQSVGLPSERTADVLADVLGPADLAVGAVVCGDLSYDRGSGAVPALLAHHLQFAQALGLLEVRPHGPGKVSAVRRLDGARRERLAVTGPFVLSVEGGVANLRRAALGAALGGSARPGAGAAHPAPAGTVEVRTGRIERHVEPPRLRPWRPRARVMPAPRGESVFDRIVTLTGAMTERTPPRTVEATPAEAAHLIVGQLREWGYLDHDRK